MRLELVPLIFGGLIGLVGLGLLLDACTPEHFDVKHERRRSPRAERSRGGEAAIGLGVICMAAAFVGRDTWRYCVVAVIVGCLLLFAGVFASRRFLAAAISRRGALRRRDGLQ
jgi:4-hydroxybenzoate polyprenyltransferase